MPEQLIKTAKASGFDFVLNPVIFHGELPIEIIPDHWFDRADEEQREIIKTLLSKSNLTSSPQSEITPNFAVFRSRESITKFLEQAVKLLTLVALKEPVLLTGLKKC